MTKTQTCSSGRAAALWVVAGIVFLMAVPALASGLAGDLDLSFGTDGVASTTAEWGPGIPMARQSSGKLVYGAVDRTVDVDGVTTTSSFWRIQRATASGTPDTNFGTNGEVTLFAEHGTWHLRDLVVDGSNRILGTGQASFEITTTSGRGKKQKTTTSVVQRFVVARLLEDGALDTSFGEGGVAAIEIPGATSSEGIGWALHVLADGRILAAGSAREVASSSGGGGGKGKKGGGSTTKSDAIALVRLLASGDLDTTFGDQGITVHDATAANDQPGPGMIGVQASGRIMLGAWSRGLGYSAESALSAYDADGTVNAAFGRVTLSGHSLRGMAVDANDRILASGDVKDTAGDPEFALQRRNTDGSLDTSFGSGGTASIGALDPSQGGSVMEQSDGKIVVAVALFDGSDYYSHPVRFTDAGVLDPAFGMGGAGEALQEAGIDFLLDRGLVVDGQGDITMSGMRLDGASIKWILVRWCGS